MSAMSLGKKIVALRKERGWNQRELAKRAGFDNQSRLSNYERDFRKPDIEDLGKIAKALGVSVDFFLRGNKSPSQAEIPAHTLSVRNVEPAPAMRRTIPVVRWEDAEGWRARSPEARASAALALEETDNEMSQHAFALKVRGDSMEPVFPDGSIVIADPERAANHNDYVIAKIGNTAPMLKQLVIDGPQRYLKPLNPRYPLVTVEGDLQIIATVIEVVMRRSF